MYSPRSFRLLSILLLSICLAPAQWVKTNGPSGGTILSLVKKGPYVFAGTKFSGVYRSSDNGAHWAPCNNGLINKTVHCLAACGNRLFAGTDAGWIFSSDDDGDTWEVAYDINDRGYSILSLAVHNKTVLAGRINSEMYRSTDSGRTWTRLGGVYGDYSVIGSMAVQGNVFYATANGQYSPRVLRSTNDGASWVATRVGAHTDLPLCLAANDSAVFVGNSTGVDRSVDGGLTWIPNSPANTSLSVNCMAIMGPNLFVGTDRFGVMRIPIGDTVANPVNTGMETANINALLVDSETFLAGAVGNGIFRTSDFGASWARGNTGLANTGVHALLAHGSSLLATVSGGGISRSSDGGSSWTAQELGITDTGISLAAAGSTLFAGTQKSGIYRSLDDGINWVSCDNGMGKPNITSLAADDANIYAATLKHGVYRSKDFGASWMQPYTGMADSSIYAIFVHNNHVFIITDSGGLYRSNDTSGAWKFLGKEGSLYVPSHWYGFAEMGNLLYKFSAYSTIFVSSDDGDHWSVATNTPHRDFVLAIGVFNGQLVAGGDGRPYCSVGDINHWTLFDQGLPAGEITSAFAAVSGKLFAGTFADGIWVRSLSDVPVQLGAPRSSHPPLEIDWSSGMQLRTGSTIRLSIPIRAKVELAVFDNRGKKVKTLLNRITDEGSIQVPFLAEDFPDGTYFLRLNADGFSRTRKFRFAK